MQVQVIQWRAALLLREKAEPREAETLPCLSELAGHKLSKEWSCRANHDQSVFKPLNEI